MTGEPLRLVGFRAVKKGSLRGFATVELPVIGLTIRDCPVHEVGQKTWASLPARPQVDSAGRLVRDAAGKASYAAILEWRDRKLRDHFSRRVAEAVRAQHPSAFDAPNHTEQSEEP